MGGKGYEVRVGIAKNKATPNIDPRLHREFKVEAAKRGLKIGEFAERLMKEGLRKTER